MAQILNDFADLGVLKAKLSREDVVPAVKRHHSPLVQIRLQGNVYYDYNTYLDAAAAAVKAYPILSINYKNIQYTSSKKEKYIALGKNGHRYFFRFNMMSDKRVYKSLDRISAFRTIMFVYLELRKIAASHIQIIENAGVGNFVLSINEIPLVASSYKRYTGTFPMLKVLKQQMLDGSHKPTSVNEEDALKMGVKFREKVAESSIYDEIEIIPETDYSTFGHSEKIKASTKPGFVEPDKTPKVNTKPKSRVIPGRSLPAPHKNFHSSTPWMDNWDDRFDHDD